MTKKQKKMLVRLAASAVFLAAGLVTEGTHPVDWICFAVSYLAAGYDIPLKALRMIRNGQVFDENFLMTVATAGAILIGAYEEAVAVMLFYQVGELFNDYAVNRSRKSISDLMDINPEFANVLRDGKEEQVDPDEVRIGETVVIRPGERVPLDGVVVKGASSLDTKALTGESMPVEIAEGEDIVSGSINLNGLLEVRVTKRYDDSTVAKVLELVENASARKAKLENFITRFARVYTPVVVFLALALAVLPPLVAGQPWSVWIYRACSFLVVSCPCALVISVPLSFFGGLGAASKQGILIKGSNYLEALGMLDTVVFDKTGTLTTGKFQVTSVEPERCGWQELLELAAYGESHSTHPIALSVMEAWRAVSGMEEEQRRQWKTFDAKMITRSRDVAPSDGASDGAADGAAEGRGPGALRLPDQSRIVSVEEIAGQGIHAVLREADRTEEEMSSLQAEGTAPAAAFDLYIGNDKLMKSRNISFKARQNGAGKDDVGTDARGTDASGQDVAGQDAGGTTLYVAKNREYLGAVTISDTIRDDVGAALSGLRGEGVRKLVMLTGDKEAVGKAVGRKLGLDRVYGGLLPGDKVAKVEELLTEKPAGRTLAFVGDGINDAPVLSRADVGIAMGGIGSDAAVEAADVVIMTDEPSKIVEGIRIARKTVGIVRQNIIFAIGVKILILILVALGIFGMWMAVFGDVGVAVLAILNAIRALNYRRKEQKT